MSDLKYTRREFLKIGLWTLLSGSAMGLGGYSYASKIEPDWIDISEIELSLPRLPKSFDGYKITQISDIHLGSWMTAEHLADIIDLVNQSSPDIIVITGDFVSRSPEDFRSLLIYELGRLEPREKTYAVLGNHDHWTNAAILREVLTASNVVELNNQTEVIERETDHLYICGVDDHWEKHDRIDLVTGNLPPGACAILLAHEPDFGDISAATGRFDLQLSGHSHGGQVVIPFFGAPVLPPYGQKYPQGLYQIEDMLLYTNRGVGMIPPLIRFNCRPEISVFTLKSSPKANQP